MNRTWLGIGFVALLAAALVYALTTGNDNPATSTTVIAAPTSTAAPTTTTTTTTSAPTTTQDLTQREADIEALVKELDLQFSLALHDGDAVALAEVVVTEGALWDALQGTLGEPGDFFTEAPTADTIGVQLDAVLLDRDDCLVVDIVEDLSQFLDGVEPDQVITLVLWATEDAPLGYRIVERFDGVLEQDWLGLCDAVDRS